MKNRKDKIKIDWLAVAIISILTIMYVSVIIVYLVNSSSNPIFIDVWGAIALFCVGGLLYIIIKEMPFIQKQGVIS